MIPEFSQARAIMVDERLNLIAQGLTLIVMVVLGTTIPRVSMCGTADVAGKLVDPRAKREDDGVG
jgi:hypothetical protein